MDKFPQATDVNEAQVPEKSCSLAFAGADDIVIVGLVVWATKVYHTSLRFAVPHPMEGIFVYVAPPSDPSVLTQASPEVNEMAPLHRSFAGAGSVIQMSKKS